MRIALIFNKDREDTIGIYFERAFKNLTHTVTHFWTKDAQDIPLEFDLYLRIDHGDYKYDIPEYLHPSAFYIVDTHLKKPYKRIRRQVWHYDYIFCAHREGAERLKRDKGVDAIWIPVGCDIDIHRNLNIERRFDIGFVGTDGKKSIRKILLKELRKLYPNSFIGMAPYAKLSEIYSASKIGFNYSINNDINMRYFEVMSCGAMLITNRIRDRGSKDILKDKEHLRLYRNRKELFKLIDYYLTHDTERELISKNGYELVISRHTYKDRLRQMLEIIERDLRR